MKANMDEELIYCKQCNANFLVQWEQDEYGDTYLTPSYCPLCGTEIRGDEREENYDETFED